MFSNEKKTPCCGVIGSQSQPLTFRLLSVGLHVLFMRLKLCSPALSGSVWGLGLVYMSNCDALSHDDAVLSPGLDYGSSRDDAFGPCLWTVVLFENSTVDLVVLYWVCVRATS